MYRLFHQLNNFNSVSVIVISETALSTHVPQSPMSHIILHNHSLLQPHQQQNWQEHGEVSEEDVQWSICSFMGFEGMMGGLAIGVPCGFKLLMTSRGARRRRWWRCMLW